jgi:hypothetical protein
MKGESKKKWFKHLRWPAWEATQGELKHKVCDLE